MKILSTIHERSERHRLIVDTGKFSSALVTNIGTDTLWMV